MPINREEFDPFESYLDLSSEERERREAMNIETAKQNRQAHLDRLFSSRKKKERSDD